MKKEIRKKDIAIVGLSCKFNKSEDTETFWRNLVEGNELLHFYKDEELLELGVDEEVINNPDFVKVNSFIKNADSFDYPFFGYTKDEASFMDPQIRVLHEQVWSALEDAGCDIVSYKEKVGLMLSASDNINWMAHALLNQNNKVNPFFLSQISNKNFISTLISYSLNLKGPSYYSSTACSSSLTSVHLACRSLLMRECSMAVAGGIRLGTTDKKGYYFKEGMIGSKDGHCRAFDEKSTGTVGGDGGAVVVLKRLEDALNDRDNIYAVIRSSAVNNDGKRKVGFTAPSIIGQSECIKLAHRIANVPYDTISYVEAHGTGTKLGDPIEIEALNKAFNYDSDHKCAIGSVKTNAGHLDSAAGVAGLVKTSLALKNKIIPPTLHFEKPNPEINFDDGPFYVNSEVKKWENKSESPLRAGVSSFGIGGTNVHVVLEESPEIEKGSSSRPFQILPYSAKNQKALISYKNKLEHFLVNNEECALEDLAYTLKTGRNAFSHRSFIVCRDKNDALNQLKNEVLESISTPKRNIVLMFSGQGSQYFGMAKDVYHQEPYFKSIMDKGFQVLSDKTGKDFTEVLGYTYKKGTDKDLINNTYYAQPIIFLIEYAFASLLMKWGIHPTNMIGHSLGEYAAACIAEVFSMEDGLDILIKRSSLMSKVEKGDMLAIGESIDAIKKMITPGVSIAAINTESSCVVSGNKKSVNKFSEVLLSLEIPFTKLKTSHAFHSNMMDAILEEYRKELKQISLSTPKLPFISNVTGKPITNEEATSPDYWVKHLREPVSFSEGISYLLGNKNSSFIEVGPGKTLTTFCKQNKNFGEKNMSIGLLRHPKEEKNDNQTLHEGIGVLWSNGVDIDWKEYYADETRNKVSIPTYCFNNYSFPLKVNPFEQLTQNGILNNIKKPVSEWFYTSNWKKSFISSKEELKDDLQNYLIFSGNNKLVQGVKNKLLKEDKNVIEVRKGELFEQHDTSSYSMHPEKDFTKLFEKLALENIEVNNIIFNWDFEGEDQKEILSAFSVILNLCKELIRYRPDAKKKITFLSNFNQRVLGNEKINIASNTIKTIISVCGQENLNIFCCSIDTDQNTEDSILISKIEDELKFNYDAINIAYRNETRWVEFYDNIPIHSSGIDSQIKSNKTYLVTGGLGEVGSILVDHLLDNYDSKIIIIGRSEIPSKELWTDYLKDKGTEASVTSKIEKLKKLKDKGKEVFYYQVDVADSEKLATKIKTIESEQGAISGIIHAAGNVDNKTFKSIENIDIETVRKQFDPKIKGTMNLHSIFKDRDLDFVWITSSLSAILGGLTYGAYATANRFMDVFIDNKREELKNWFCLNLAGIGVGAIQQKDLVDVFEKTFSLGSIQNLIVSLKDPNLVVKKRDEVINNKESDNSDELIDRPESYADYEPPISEVEKQLCNELQSFFGYKKIGLNDNFFELGGDSLKAMTLIKRIHALYGIEINLKDFFKKPKIKDLSNEIELALKLINVQKKSKGSNVIKI
ncbi:type I polyketide synthase [uncultured Aquimarina sp.]|uniref:type I polyketide synthase n=1 Tax=uncultured Aquimarina sp. TaxID=575652 RepID=UPI00262ABCF8|nr:type I polyketide synthase [uncultured Aquimarina sp.]